MSYKITITNNKTGEIIVDNGNAVAIVGAIADEEKVGQMWFTSCNPLTLAIAIQEAEGVISKIKREVPEVDASLRLITKQEQIEEMAKDIVRIAGLDVYGKAEELVNLGYRKLPEDSAILTKVEKQKLPK